MEPFPEEKINKLRNRRPPLFALGYAMQGRRGRPLRATRGKYWLDQMTSASRQMAEVRWDQDLPPAVQRMSMDRTSFAPETA